MTTDQDRQLLLRLARETIAAHLGRSRPDPQSAIVNPQSAIVNPQSAIVNPQSAVVDPQSAVVNPQSAVADPQSAVRNPQFVQPSILTQLRGAFVTLHNRGALRGCIGHIEANQPLGDVVASCAVAACSADPRFAPITHMEFAEIDIEISLLGTLESIAGPTDVVVGRHGLVVEEGWKRGLLLPQVATEWNWDAETFLAQACHKAGLPHNAWKHGAALWRFEADVFGEATQVGWAG
jgi:AmmeMemoRadiSam system protein A